MPTAREVIALHGLRPLPGEGGWYRETFRSAWTLPAPALPAGYTGPRSLSTAILYLLAAGEAAVPHRVPGEEVWHFLQGDPLEMLLLPPGGPGTRARLGPGGRLQQGVPPRCWQGARLAEGGAWALVACTMSPGFEFEDWEAGDPVALAVEFPAFEADISRLYAKRS